MNPITKKLEGLGWSWNSVKQVYVLEGRNDTLTYEEAKKKVLSGNIDAHTGYLKSQKRKKGK